MNRKLRSLITVCCAAVASLPALAGCDATGGARYVPPADVARTSLEAALAAWRDGRPCGPIEAAPPIQIADSRWQNGQQIEAFQIGDEQPDGDGTRQFPVKLTIKKSGKVEEVRYIVHGRDPVWIYSDIDYKRMIDMGNGTEPARPRTPVARRSGR
jgi:hypothetical protein